MVRRVDEIAGENPEDDPEMPAVVWQGRAVVFLSGGVALVAFIAAVIESAFLIFEIVKDRFFQADFAKLESEAEMKYTSDFLKKVKAHKHIFYNQLVKRLAVSNEGEQKFLLGLEYKYGLDSDLLGRILLGTPVLVKEDGEVFTEWSKFAKQSGIFARYFEEWSLPVEGSLITKFTFKKMRGDTWFQLETQFLSFTHIFRHRRYQFHHIINGFERSVDPKNIIVFQKSSCV